MKSRFFLTVAAAGIVCAHTLAVQSAVAQAKPTTPAKPVTQTRPAQPAGPWAKVPALPTACYASQDKWMEQNAAAFDAVQNDHYRQNDINDAIRQNATDTFGADPMAVAARLQQKMMEDPANAQKYMEEMTQQNQQAQVETPAQLEREQQLAAEAKTLMKKYEAALGKAMAPGNVRLAALLKKYSPPEGAGDLWMRYGDTGQPAWVKPEAHAILKEWDQAYAATCPQWWTATGLFHAYMKRYKDFLIQERIPHEKKFSDGPKLEHYRTIGVATSGWRTTSDYEAAEDYMNMALSLFEQRETDPRCPAGVCGR